MEAVMVGSSYPSTQILTNDGGPGVITFAGGASSNILAPLRGISGVDLPYVPSTNRTNTATVVPRWLHNIHRLPLAPKLAMLVSPVFFGTASDAGSNDAAAKSCVMSLVAVHDIGRLSPATPEPEMNMRVLSRELLACVRFTADTGTGLALAGTETIRRLTTPAEFATYTAANARAVFAASATPLEAALMPSGLFRYGNAWGFDVGTADAIEVYVSCVADVTGSPSQSAPAVNAFINFLAL
jgi:hypothetical protein